MLEKKTIDRCIIEALNRFTRTTWIYNTVSGARENNRNCGEGDQPQTHRHTQKYASFESTGRQLRFSSNITLLIPPPSPFRGSLSRSREDRFFGFAAIISPILGMLISAQRGMGESRMRDDRGEEAIQLHRFDGSEDVWFIMLSSTSRKRKSNSQSPKHRLEQQPIIAHPTQQWKLTSKVIIQPSAILCNLRFLRVRYFIPSMIFNLHVLRTFLLLSSNKNSRFDETKLNTLTQLSTQKHTQKPRSG